jgi:hypothetical protein
MHVVHPAGDFLRSTAAAVSMVSLLSKITILCYSNHFAFEKKKKDAHSIRANAVYIHSELSSTSLTQISPLHVDPASILESGPF